MAPEQLDQFNFYAALLIGLLSSGHCIVMCGGVVSVLSANIPLHQNHGSMRFAYLLSYNLGRILSYCMAGALLGYSFSYFGVKSHIIFQAMHLLSGLMLILIGLYIGRWLNAISHIEQLGKSLWKVLAPVAKRLIPFKSPLSALPFGLVWGWLPCGLVYSTLTWSAASGTALDGAAIMLGFGLGTLPTMITVGFVSSKLKSLLQNNFVRSISAMIIIGFGLNILYLTLLD